MDLAVRASVPMERGARFVFLGSAPMQRGARFSISVILWVAQHGSSQGARNVMKHMFFLMFFKKKAVP